MRIKIQSTHNRALGRFLKDSKWQTHLESLGVEIVDKAPDLTIQSGQDDTPLYDSEGLVAIEDCDDSPIISPKMRKLIVKKQCLGIFRNCVSRHAITQNGLIFQTDHCHIQTAMSCEGCVTSRMWDEQYIRHDIIPHQFLDKIHLAFPLIPFIGGDGTKYPFVTSLPPLHSRPVDVLFIGHIEYQGACEDVPAMATLHRRRMAEAVSALPFKTKVIATSIPPGGSEKDRVVLLRADFMKELLDAKITISPWGWSVWSQRDVEAVLCGCFPVKPITDDFVTWPNLYDRKASWHKFCRHDYSDLRQVVSGILADIEQEPAHQTHKRRQLAAQYHKDHSLKPAITNYVELLKRCVEAHQW